MIAVAGGILIVLLILAVGFAGCVGVADGNSGGWVLLACAVGAMAWVIF